LAVFQYKHSTKTCLNFQKDFLYPNFYVILKFSKKIKYIKILRTFSWEITISGIIWILKIVFLQTSVENGLRKYRFLNEILIFDRIFNFKIHFTFWPTFQFWPTFRFLTKISISYHNFCFLILLLKYSSFDIWWTFLILLFTNNY